jgi:hypothetical protein
LIASANPPIRQLLQRASVQGSKFKVQRFGLSNSGGLETLKP